MAEKRVRETHLSDLVPAELLSSAGIDPFKPAGSFLYRGGSRCHVFDSTPNSTQDVLYIIQRKFNGSGSRTFRSSRWYWKISDEETVRKILDFSRTRYTEINPLGLQFVDSAQLVAGSALAEIIENYSSPFLK